MDRKTFLKQGTLATGIFAASTTGLGVLANNIDELKERPLFGNCNSEALS